METDTEYISCLLLFVYCSAPCHDVILGFDINSVKLLTLSRVMIILLHHSDWLSQQPLVCRGQIADVIHGVGQSEIAFLFLFVYFLS